jgi:hypothetical protein
MAHRIQSGWLVLQQCRVGLATRWADLTWGMLVRVRWPTAMPRGSIPGFCPAGDRSMRSMRPGTKLRVRPEIADVSNLNHENQIWLKDSARRLHEMGNRLWHTDSSFKRVPALASLLYAYRRRRQIGRLQPERITRARPFRASPCDSRRCPGNPDRAAIRPLQSVESPASRECGRDSHP